MKINVGEKGEQLIQQHIRTLGWKIVATNFHSRFGEIDIIAQEKKEIVFIEVKTRTNARYGSPQESVTPSKLKKMLLTAQWYLLANRQESSPYRFDVFSVLEKDDIVSIEHYKNVSAS